MKEINQSCMVFNKQRRHIRQMRQLPNALYALVFVYTTLVHPLEHHKDVTTTFFLRLNLTRRSFCFRARIGLVRGFIDKSCSRFILVIRDFFICS